MRNDQVKVVDPLFTNFRFEAINCFSVKWPYLCYGDFESQEYIYIINVYDQN